MKQNGMVPQHKKLSLLDVNSISGTIYLLLFPGLHGDTDTEQVCGFVLRSGGRTLHRAGLHRTCQCGTVSTGLCIYILRYKIDTVFR